MTFDYFNHDDLGIHTRFAVSKLVGDLVTKTHLPSYPTARHIAFLQYLPPRNDAMSLKFFRLVLHPTIPDSYPAIHPLNVIVARDSSTLVTSSSESVLVGCMELNPSNNGIQNYGLEVGSR